MQENQLTPEQIAANKAAEQAAKAAEKARVAAEKKAAKELAAAEKKAAAEAAKAAKAAEKQAKADEKAKIAAAKAEAKAAKAAVKMPEQNGITQPKASSSCGKIWEIANQLSSKLKQPVPIKDLLETASAEGYNEATIKTQYARWRKFHGVSGRVAAPAAPTAETSNPDTAAE